MANASAGSVHQYHGSIPRSSTAPRTTSRPIMHSIPPRNKQRAMGGTPRDGYIRDGYPTRFLKYGCQTDGCIKKQVDPHDHRLPGEEGGISHERIPRASTNHCDLPGAAHTRTQEHRWGSGTSRPWWTWRVSAKPRLVDIAQIKFCHANSIGCFYTPDTVIVDRRYPPPNTNHLQYRYKGDGYYQPAIRGVYR